MYVRNHIGPPVRGKEPTRPEKDLSCVVLGLMNGTTGTLVDIVFEPDSDPLEIRYVIVDFPKVASKAEALRNLLQNNVSSINAKTFLHHVTGNISGATSQRQHVGVVMSKRNSVGTV